MKKAVRIIVLVVLSGLILGLVIYNAYYQPPISEEVWDEGTTIGDSETATRHYVQYSDLACPYCDVFTRLTIENEEEFSQYLADHQILFEIRLTEMLFDSVGSEISRDSAVAAYCARREGKFVDYYHAGVMALYEDYHSKGIGDSKTAPKITGMADDYWLEIGHKLGLGEEFDSCVGNQETLSEVAKNTKKAEQQASGLPFFQFDKYTFAGFDNTWGWEYVVRYLDAGL